MRRREGTLYAEYSREEGDKDCDARKLISAYANLPYRQQRNRFCDLVIKFPKKSVERVASSRSVGEKNAHNENAKRLRPERNFTHNSRAIKSGANLRAPSILIPRSQMLRATATHAIIQPSSTFKLRKLRYMRLKFITIFHKTRNQVNNSISTGANSYCSHHTTRVLFSAANRRTG